MQLNDICVKNVLKYISNFKNENYVYFASRRIVLRNRKATKRLLLFAGLILVTVSFLLIALIFLLRYEWMWTWWKQYQEFLHKLEDNIFSIRNTWLFIGVIMALYVIKTVIPIYTTSTVCFIAGAVLPSYLAIPLNIIGTAVQMTIK